MFRNVGIKNSDAWSSPTRKNTTFGQIYLALLCRCKWNPLNQATKLFKQGLERITCPETDSVQHKPDYCSSILCVQISARLQTFLTIARIYITSNYLLRIFTQYYLMRPIPVAARSKVWVCGRSPLQLAFSNLAGDMNICLLLMLCVVK